jgi:hypothetical protein
MIVWIIGIILVILIFVLIEMKYLKHKIKWILLVGCALFIYITFMASISGQNIELNTAEGLKQAGTLYASWLVNGFENMKTLTSHAVKLDWNMNISSIR